MSYSFNIFLVNFFVSVSKLWFIAIISYIFCITGTRQEVNEAIMNMITGTHHPEMGVAAETEIAGAIHAT